MPPVSIRVLLIASLIAVSGFGAASAKGYDQLKCDVVQRNVGSDQVTSISITNTGSQTVRAHTRYEFVLSHGKLTLPGSVSLPKALGPGQTASTSIDVGEAKDTCTVSTK